MTTFSLSGAYQNGAVSQRFAGIVRDSTVLLGTALDDMPGSTARHIIQRSS